MTPEPQPPARSGGHYRWVVCALLFFAATVNYIDRQVIGILKPTLMKEFQWGDERIYAAIVFSFQLAYAIGLLLAGRVMDWMGTRRGFALAVVLWSLAAVAHAGADWFPGLRLPTLNLDASTGFAVVMVTGAAAGFALARFALGLGEAGSFPASIKTVAEWFPRKERALATGIFNAGTNVGALVTPLVVPWVTLHWGWKWAFIGTGLTGFMWVVWWLRSYRSPETHPRLSPSELAYIRSDPPEAMTPIAWRKLLPHPPDLGFRARQIHDRSHLVALPLLDPGFPQSQPRTRSQIHRPAADRHLSRGGRRQHRWRLAVIGADQARLEGQYGAQDGDALLRRLRAADHGRRESLESLGRRRSGVAGGGGASRLVREPVHAHLRHVSASCGGFRRGHRRHGGRGGRDDDLAGGGRNPPAHR